MGGSGDWNTTTNWSTGALPASSDDVVVSSTNTSITVTHSSGVHTVQSLMSQRAFQLTGGSLTVSNTVQVNNPLTLAGATLVRATVLQGTNGATFAVNGSSVLGGVTVNGVLDVGKTYASAVLTVTNGLVLAGTALVGNPTNNWYGGIRFLGSQTLSGNGTVVFGTDSYNGYGMNGRKALWLANGGTTLTIGSGITVRGQNGYIGAYTSAPFYSPANMAVINLGTISADVSGGIITIVAQPFLNQGWVQSPAGTLNLAGTISGGGLGNLQSGNGPLLLTGVLTNGGQMVVLSGLTNMVTLQGGRLWAGRLWRLTGPH